MQLKECYEIRTTKRIAGLLLSVGQDKNDGKLTSSLLYYYFLSLLLIIRICMLILNVFNVSSLVECSIYNVTFNILLLMVTQVNDKQSMYLPLEIIIIKKRFSLVEWQEM